MEYGGGCFISPAYVIKFSNEDINFILKLNTKIGNFYEIEFGDRVTDSYIIKLIKSLNLQYWNYLEYKEWLKDVWKNVKKDNISTLKKKYWSDIIRLSDSIYTSNRSIKYILKNISNDYTEVDYIFNLFTNKHLWSVDDIDMKCFQSIDMSISASIVIPSYNSSLSLNKTLESINNNILPSSWYNNIEIIVVDDGTIDNSIEKVVHDYNLRSQIVAKYIKIKENSGRSYARNVGAALAKGDILFFIDSDIIIGKKYIFEHIIRHKFFNKMCLVSFKKDIYSFNSFKKFLTSMRPKFFSDFRVKKTVDPTWKGIYSSVKNKKESNILKDTDYFIEFGYRKNIHIWDLSCMVTTSNISLKRTEFIKIGGFHRAFKGWGFEDTFLGSCLIANGNYIVPVLSTGVWHFCSKKINKNKRYKSKMFKDNLKEYLKLINMPFRKIIEY